MPPTRDSLRASRLPTKRLPPAFCKFVLKSSLSPGGTAEAYYVPPGGDAPDGTIITVSDYRGDRRGIGLDDGQVPHRGMAIKFSSGGIWQIFDLVCPRYT